MTTSPKTETESQRVARMELRQRYIQRKRRRLIRAEKMPREAPAGAEWDHRDHKPDFVDPVVNDPSVVKAEIKRWESEREADAKQIEDGYRGEMSRRAVADARAEGGDRPGINWMGHTTGAPRAVGGRRLNLFGWLED